MSLNQFRLLLLNQVGLDTSRSYNRAVPPGGRSTFSLTEEPGPGPVSRRRPAPG